MIRIEVPERLKRSLIKWAGPWILEDSAIIIAGGFIRAFFAGEEPSDLDLYTETPRDAKRVDKILLEEKWDKTFQTERADSYIKNGRMIQIIKVVHGEVKDIFDEFDFTVIKAAYYQDEIWHDESFFPDLAARVLVYTGSRWPLASLKRVFKYIKRGYNICDENIIKIAENITEEVDFTDEEELEEHIAGMDPNGERSISLID